MTQVERMGWVIGLKPEKIADYRALHADAWPEILAKITECNIRNYTIFLREPESLLFAYWEYIGEDFNADMERMKEHPKTQDWLARTDPCQDPLATREPDEQWARLEEIFHLK
ncbi:MAG: L-rhamnose mutarotase [Parvibaculaceae bacterium]|nr:L-rhamnose mutarotase [Parvibaculaceae bacterium]